MFEFNLKGLLVPGSIIKSTIEELEDEFVTLFNNELRKALFDKYKLYNTALKSTCNNIALKQWVDGSFVTKKNNPARY